MPVARIWDGSQWIDIGGGGGGEAGPHADTHEDGGSDEVNVAGLSGELANPQPPKAHKASHQEGGADDIGSVVLSLLNLKRALGIRNPSEFTPGTTAGWQAAIDDLPA